MSAEPAAPPQRSAGGTAARLGLLAVSGLVALLVAELALRGLGYEPWRPRAPALLVEPEGRLYAAHETRGYAPIPGRHSVLFPTGLRFRVTHDRDGHRRTALEGAVPADGARPEIWIFGGSFTYGWALDDAATFPARLQARFPGARVRNFGVPGYGTLHALVELEERLYAGGVAPAVVVIAYASFHDVRNTFARERRKRVAPYNELGPLVQPYARLSAGGEMRRAMATVEYRPWPGQRRSALVHLLETRWNQAERLRLDEAALTDAVLGEIAALSREAGARLLVATLTAGARAAEIRDLAEGLGGRGVDLGIDLDRPGYRNTPHDAHPSARATAEYAELLARAFRELPELTGTEERAPRP